MGVGKGGHMYVWRLKSGRICDVVLDNANGACGGPEFGIPENVIAFWTANPADKISVHLTVV